MPAIQNADPVLQIIHLTLSHCITFQSAHAGNVEWIVRNKLKKHVPMLNKIEDIVKI